MSTREFSLAGAILLVVLGVRLGPSSNKQELSNVRATPAQLKTVKTGSPVPAVWNVLCQLNPEYGADPILDEKLLSIPDHAHDPNCLSTQNPSEDLITSVIATVADPVRTNLSLVTDRTLETIQAASAEAGYIPYLQGLQWPSISTLSKDRSVTDQSTDNSSSKNGLEQATDNYPGVLLFRASGETAVPAHPKYLAVFLVSETPTTGLDRKQFLAALRIIGNIPRRNKEKPRTVLVAGPNFSGSVPSLRELSIALSEPAPMGGDTFAQSADPVRCLHAFSGTITNADLPVSDSPCALKVDTFQTDDQTALCAFQTWATGVGFRNEQVAILSEEGTQYGQQTQEAKTQLDSQSQVCNGHDHFLRLHFPRGIAALRNATDPAQTQHVGLPTDGGPQRLPLRWQDSGSSSDEVPLYGAYQTSLSQETVLASLADTLKTQHAKTLGILATDPWDVTFLIHWFTEASPNVRLFVRDADLLYLRTPDVGSVTGVLALTDYPLIFENQFWSANQNYRGDRRLLMLPSSTQESQYNAFTELIGHLQPPIVDRPLRHLEDQRLSNPVPPDRNRHLWLATTGTRGYLPIKPMWKEGPQENLHALDIGQPSYAAITLWCLIATVALAHAISVLVAVRSKPDARQEHREQGKLLHAVSCVLCFDLGDQYDAIGSLKLVCHAVALSTAGLATLIAGASFVFFYRSALAISLRLFGDTLRINLSPMLAGLVLIVTLFVAVVACISLQKGVKTCSARSKNLALTLKEHRALVQCGTIFVAIPLIGMGYWLYLGTFGTFENAFMHLRDLRLGSGIAPILPILFLIGVYYSGTWVYLRRVSRWEYGSGSGSEFGSASMPTGLDDVFPSNCNQHVERITHALFQLPESPWGGILVACLTAGFLLFRPWTTMEMLEPRPLQWFTLVWFCLASLLLWSNWLRFLYIWQQMQLFLRILEKLPMRAAFSRISTQSTLSIWGWNIAPGKLLPVREAVEALRGLHRLTGDTFVSASARKRLLSVTREFLIATSEAQEEEIEYADELAEQPKATQTKASEEQHNGIETVVHQQKTLMVVGGEIPAGATQETLRIEMLVKPPDRAVPISVSGSGSPNGNRAERSPISKSSRLSISELKQLYHESRQAMKEVIQQLIPHLYSYWHRGEVWPANAPIRVDRPGRKTDSLDQRYELAEELVALRFYAYIRYVGTELRHLLLFVVLAFSGLFVALHGYSFRASRAIDLAFITLFVALGLGVVVAFGQQERDALLSRLQRTTPGELGANFYIDILKYAALPALALVASQVPSVSNFFIRWIQPGLDVFH